MAADRQKSKPELNSALLPALLFFVVLGAFSPCLWNGFVNFDDPLYLTDNTHVKQGLTWEGFKWAWTSGEAQNWHPLTWISHMVDVQFFGLNPAGHHAINVLLHALNTAILFLLLQKLTGTRWRSFAVAALFGLHPLRVESVAWVAERKDVLSVLFWLLATWAYFRWTKKPDPEPTPSLAKSSPAPARWYWTSVALFTCGLLCKPMLVTLPFALLLLDYWPLKRWPQTSAKQLSLEKVPFLMLAAASSVATYLVQRSTAARHHSIGHLEPFRPAGQRTRFLPAVYRDEFLAGGSVYYVSPPRPLADGLYSNDGGIGFGRHQCTGGVAAEIHAVSRRGLVLVSGHISRRRPSGLFKWADRTWQIVTPT